MSQLKRIVGLIEDLIDYNADNYYSNKELEDIYHKDFSVDTSFLRYSNTPKVSTDVPIVLDKTNKIVDTRDVQKSLYNLFSEFELENSTYLKVTNFKISSENNVVTVKFRVSNDMVEKFEKYLSNFEYDYSDFTKTSLTNSTTQIEFKLL